MRITKLSGSVLVVTMIVAAVVTATAAVAAAIHSSDLRRGDRMREADPINSRRTRARSRFPSL